MEHKVCLVHEDFIIWDLGRVDVCNLISQAKRLFLGFDPVTSWSKLSKLTVALRFGLNLCTLLRRLVWLLDNLFMHCVRQTPKNGRWHCADRKTVIMPSHVFLFFSFNMQGSVMLRSVSWRTYHLTWVHLHWQKWIWQAA